MRILIRGPNYLGDHIMAFDFYQAVRSRYPGAQIDLLIKDAVANWHDGQGWNRVFKLSQKNLLKGEAWDVGFNLPASYSSQIAFNFIKIKKRMSFTEGLPLCFGKNIFWKGVKAKKHKSQLYLELLPK